MWRRAAWSERRIGCCMTGKGKKKRSVDKWVYTSDFLMCHWSCWSSAAIRRSRSATFSPLLLLSGDFLPIFVKRLLLLLLLWPLLDSCRSSACVHCLQSSLMFQVNVCMYEHKLSLLALLLAVIFFLMFTVEGNFRKIHTWWFHSRQKT